MNNNAPFKYDIVGSFLRPDYLKKARSEYVNGKITAEELKKVENAAITDLITESSWTKCYNRWRV